MSARIYVDANIFIAMVEQPGERAGLLTCLFSNARASRTPFIVTSELTLAELLVVPYRRHDASLISLYQNWLGSNERVHVEVVSRPILELAAQLRAAIPSLRLPDAIHLATSISCDCQRFMTFDRKLSASSFAFDMEAIGRISSPSFLPADEATLSALLAELSPV